jgi:hypothetical protein
MDDGDFWRKPRPYKDLGQTGAARRVVSSYVPTTYVQWLFPRHCCLSFHH